MSSRRSGASDVRRASEVESIQDVGMRDTLEAEESDIDAEGEPDTEMHEDDGQDTFQVIHDLSTYLCSVEEDGEELAIGFQRIPNRRVLPDYFEVIPNPIAFSTIRNKIQKKLYSNFPEFVRDVAQICHNAQVYNRPSAPIFGAAERLREIFSDKLQQLVAQGKITSDEAKIPDLGELPPVEDSPVPDSAIDEQELDEEDEEDDDEEEEEEEEEEDDDSEDDGGRRRRRSSRGRLSSRRDRDVDRDDDAHKKRGRPPMVLTPMEARISSILRGLRKFKGEDGTLLILPFEKLPDKSSNPDYYQTITNPIALDNIKKKAKRKKYSNVDQVMVDIERMFDNAMLYNEDDSQVHKAAFELQGQARILAEQEKAKPDDDFRDEDGKLPLAEIEFNGELWKVGDWVHIRNPNDLAKPIVAQIYRTWQDRDGQKWINACWYYRPEQTVHRFDKHFYDHEVAKTGQYRDHQIDDVVDRCFVMFVTRFGRGRPRGFPRDKEVYVCESRYNEEKFRFNKIKTWASCVPDEVREKDYEMDLFDGPPQRLRKMPSPIKHLLREDAKESDGLPKPTWGSPNAPPIVGAVHRRPREGNESPPPEPTPPPQPTPVLADIPVDTTRPSSMVSAARDMSTDASSRSVSNPFPGPVPAASQGYQQHLTPQYQPTTPAPLHQTPVPIPQPPHQNTSQVSTRPIHYQQPFHQSIPAHYAQTTPQVHPQAMNNSISSSYSQSIPPAAPRSSLGPVSGGPGLQGNIYNPPRPPEVYTLSDVVNDAIPAVFRERFQSDESGRVLFFTAPPQDRTQHGLSTESGGLGHSARFLAGRDQWLLSREKKRKERDEKAASDAEKRVSISVAAESTAGPVAAQAAYAVEKWFDTFDQDSEQWIKEAGLEGWREPVRG